MIDLDKAIATAVKTGKVTFGANAAIQNAKTGKAKMIILAVNCPKTIRADMEYYCKLSKVPLITYKGSSLDLASVCGKPFTVSALSIREPGDSEILELTQSAESEEPHGGNE
ncbi:MAG: 50S ribosomal protein L30e [Candidatus Bathyarchaeota archaeon]|jgi:large subunit ribosomal protein L30e|nr:50S ribosomal protein L30e [Candidatus Bathyarchaeota archaeon]